MSGDINSNTVDGLLAFCEYLEDRGYAAASQIGPWKIAVRKMFSIVEDAEEIGGISLAEFDSDDYVRRFEVKARGKYKHESLAAYVRRVTNALDAYRYFLENGKPPEFRQVSKRSTAEVAARPKTQSKVARVKVAERNSQEEQSEQPPAAGMLDHVFPLRSGHMARLRLPQVLEKDDAERLVLFLRALMFEPQGQLPAGTSNAA
jgi:hypothetical protein